MGGLVTLSIYIYNDKWDFICNPVLTQGKLSMQYLSQYGDDV